MKSKRESESGIQTIRDLIDHRAVTQPVIAFLIGPEGGRILTFRGLQEQSRFVSIQLQQLRLERGDKVAFLMDNGLFTAVAQEHGTGQVLMVAWMDDVALAHTLETRKATYYSRSRQQHWVKGETSGHTQYVHSVRLDCDGDTVLLEVDQVGAACHTGDHSCFDADLLLGPEA